MQSSNSPEQIRARLDQDLAQGKTIVLSSSELDDASLRAQLPGMLEELSRRHAGAATYPGPPLPGYTLLGEIGHGGMSTVYLARREQLGRHAAVKIAPKWLGGGERARRMLVQEAQAMARLRHPNIVAIYDILEVEDSFAIAMEWVDGGTLASLLRALPPERSDDDMQAIAKALGADDTTAFEPTTERFFAALIRDIARAAHKVHECGLVHLDIKPSNVLVRRDGTPLLADFGVTREVSPDALQTRTFAGTPAYSAPEQLRRQEARLGATTDVYGLGMTLYEALARCQPLLHKDIAEILDVVERGHIDPLRDHARVPVDLETIVHKALTPEPELRYQTAEQLADDLDAFLAGRPVAARPLTRTQRLQRRIRLEPTKYALAALLLVMIPIAVGTAVYLADKMPELEVLQSREQQEAVNRARLDAYMGWHGQQHSAERALEMLAQVEPQDPSAATVAAMLAIATEAGWPALRRTIESHAERFVDHDALRMCAMRLQQHRSFFDEDELVRLRDSDDELAAYLLAFDRLHCAEDRGHGPAYEEALKAIAHAARLRPDDRLLTVLQVWALWRSHAEGEAAAVTRAVEQRWADDHAMLAWTAKAGEHFEIAIVDRIAENLIARAPTDARGYELLAGALERTGRGAKIEEVVQRAAAAGADTRGLRELLLYRDARAGDAEAARAYLDSRDVRYVSPVRRLRLLHTIDPELAVAHAQELFRTPDATPMQLEHAYEYLEARSGNPTSYSEPDGPRDECWQVYRERYPDRQALHISQFPVCYSTEDFEQAAALARDIVVQRVAVDSQMPFVIRALITQGDWMHVRRHAERWIAHGSGENAQEAQWYAALADSRLGEIPAAIAHISAALTGSVQNRRWYVTALLEAAWLRATYLAPDNMRNPAEAKLRLGEFERRNARLRRPEVGPWTDLVRATVHWANGDDDDAREWIDKGLRHKRYEPHAPRDYEERLHELRRRIEGK